MERIGAETRGSTGRPVRGWATAEVAGSGDERFFDANSRTNSTLSAPAARTNCAMVCGGQVGRWEHGTWSIGNHVRLVRRLPCLPALLALAVLILPVSAWSGGTLSGNELRRKLIGHSWIWTSDTFDSSGTITYHRDGRVFQTTDGNSRSKAGRWRIDGDQLCLRLIGTTENCTHEIIELDEKTLYFRSSHTRYSLRE
jgi:hypothetical protein